MVAFDYGPKVSLGRVVITRAAVAALPDGDVLSAIRRHEHGDWGDLDAHDTRENELALEHGNRLLSVYHSSNGTKFYIITEHDRSLTTVLLPEDY